MKTFVCYSLQLARYLTLHGIKMDNCKVNKRNPKFFVYYFEETEEFRKVYDEYCRLYCSN